VRQEWCCSHPDAPYLPFCLPAYSPLTAAIVMRAVRNTVDTGRTVVCTIHQPSITIFDVSAKGFACGVLGGGCIGGCSASQQAANCSQQPCVHNLLQLAMCV
jgi:hypothetical protein